MSKLKLTVGLVLASLAGFSGAVQANDPDPWTEPLEHQGWDGEISDASWTTSKPAEAYAKKLLRTYQYADAWVVQHDDEDDKLYYVRFKIKGSIDDPPASPNPPASPDPTTPPTTGPAGPGPSVPGPDGPPVVAPPDDDDPSGGGDGGGYDPWP